MKVTLRPIYEGNDDITVEIDEEGVILSCSEGMQWVNEMTWRYGSPHIDALAQATSFTYVMEDEEDDETDETEPPVAEIEVQKLAPEKRQVYGWAYLMADADGTQRVDLSGDVIEQVEELEKAATSYVMKSRVQGDNHSTLGVGKMIESVVITPEKVEKWGLAPGSLPTGWWVGFQVEPEHWETVKARKQFSIHGKGIRRKIA